MMKLPFHDPDSNAALPDQWIEIGLKHFNKDGQNKSLSKSNINTSQVSKNSTPKNKNNTSKQDSTVDLEQSREELQKQQE